MNSSITKTKVDQEIINRILNNKVSEKYWIFELGIGYYYEGISKGALASAPYNSFGKALWKIIDVDLADFLCKDGIPQEWVNSLIEGNTKDLIQGIISAVAAKYNVGLGIAIPICSIVLKKGIKDYCSTPTKKSKSKKDIAKIIKNKELKVRGKD